MWASRPCSTQTRTTHLLPGSARQSPLTTFKCERAGPAQHRLGRPTCCRAARAPAQCAPPRQPPSEAAPGCRPGGPSRTRGSRARPPAPCCAWRAFVCVCECMCVCVCMCVWECVCARACVSACMCVCVCLRTLVCVCECSYSRPMLDQERSRPVAAAFTHTNTHTCTHMASYSST